MACNQDIERALEVLRNGGVILYPTDTIWGLGCDAANAEAVARIYEIKKRQDSKALICLLDNDALLERYVSGVPEVAYELIDAAVEPLTIVYDGAKVPPIAANLPAEDGSLAIRITNHRFSAELCRRLHKPLVSTSANISGQKAPSCFAEIDPEIIESVDYVCETERETPCEFHRPSNIIKLSADGQIKIIR